MIEPGFAYAGHGDWARAWHDVILRRYLIALRRAWVRCDGSRGPCVEPPRGENYLPVVARERD